jgi:hypothetical protein
LKVGGSEWLRGRPISDGAPWDFLDGREVKENDLISAPGLFHVRYTEGVNGVNEVNDGVSSYELSLSVE